MFRLAYISKSAYQISDSEMAAILEVARTNNSGLDITGILLRKDDYFFQILEGEESQLYALLEKLSKDSRHTDIEVLTAGEIKERTFGEWQMAYATLDDVDMSSYDGYSGLMNEETLSKEDIKSLSSADRAIAVFRDLNSSFDKHLLKFCLR